MKNRKLFWNDLSFARKIYRNLAVVPEGMGRRGDIFSQCRFLILDANFIVSHLFDQSLCSYRILFECLYNREDRQVHQIFHTDRQT